MDKYSILIQWSNEDQKYIASFPEFGNHAHTHGDTVEEAAKSAAEVLSLLVEEYKEKGTALPEPSLFS